MCTFRIVVGKGLDMLVVRIVGVCMCHSSGCIGLLYGLGHSVGSGYTDMGEGGIVRDRWVGVCGEGGGWIGDRNSWGLAGLCIVGCCRCRYPSIFGEDCHDSPHHRSE